METMEQPKSAIKGGEFLIKESNAIDIFIPEEWNEEQKMIAQACSDFIEKDVRPVVERLDNMEEGLMENLVEKAGELGILGISVPEEYGGLGKDFLTSMLITEVTGSGHSFSVAAAAHSGIGTLPILYYGSVEQKSKYLPGLASGQLKASYCLTEPGSGSDANSGKTKATLTEDGKHYIINGQKMWITNAGFADVFTVFVKIDDDKNLTAFIVDKGEGVTLNPEEKKMGIKGSSTRQVFFNNCKVPVENMLGKREEGFKIALNTLNIGRVKLAGATLGASKKIIDQTIKYANEREQFGRPIAKYGAIKFKIAQQTIKTFALESAVYRCSKDIEDAINSLQNEGVEKATAIRKGVEQFATEAAILKVLGSEVLDYVIDEGVQVYGGMGYSAEAPMERGYRDARINRIFEGTNEINRMLIVDMLLKKAMKGELDLMGPAMKVADELMSIPDFGDGDEKLFDLERKSLLNFKKAVLMTAGSAAKTLMMELAKEQEILMNLADMVIQAYAAESLLLRVEKLVGIKGEKACEVQINMVKSFFLDAADEIAKAGREAIFSFAEGDEQRIMLMGLKRFTKTTPFNIKDCRRVVANAQLEANGYMF